MSRLFSRIIIMLVSAVVVFPTMLNATSYYFYVQLKDKNGTPYSLDNPSVYLSERAIERRAFYSVPVDSTDLPVNPDYIRQISDVGITIHCTTKWLNGVTVQLSDTSLMSSVRTFPFVEFAQYTGRKASLFPIIQKAKADEFNYGNAKFQIDNMNGRELHKNNFTGEGIHIAVIDAGFNNVNVNRAFQTLRDEGRLLGTKDFVNPNSDIYEEDSHGAHVLSTMATEMNNMYVGTAPKASYMLIRTEETANEFPYEPDFWISGVEYADSAGVDLVTTSLGYTTFDDASMNYTYSTLDGNTARASIAANMAYGKGIVLLNSAGNDGDNAWKYISVPADALGVITVGSVTVDSVASSFSSFGPTADYRLKPDLCAIGSGSALIATNGNITWGNGTSFSAPILAGLTACYLQAARIKSPSLTLNELKNNLIKSGHLYIHPTVQLGYGIPDFKKAFEMLNLATVSNHVVENDNTRLKILVSGNKPIRINVNNTDNASKARLYSLAGELRDEPSIENGWITINPDMHPKGIYILKILTR